ncbi:MAG TPA: peptidoglycan-binding domain-containing protein [Burkholderiaceae bacterium]|nr:peptidoglycan-binding domain-containing protein [Burkholderiaceae bacterium]
MSRFLKSLSSLVNGAADRSSRRAAGESDAGPSTLTTPLFPLTASDSELPATEQPAPGLQADARSANAGDGSGTTAPGMLATLPAQPASPKSARKSASSRALHAVTRATTQIALPSHVEPTPPPKMTRAGHRSGVVLTETERLRLQVMQVQLKLTGLGLYDGAIDGMMNRDLVEGVRHFQTLKGMRDSGLLTAATLGALGIRSID